MDPEQELSAREIVAEWDERRLARALRDFGEERHAGAIARAIVRRRAEAPIETTRRAGGHDQLRDPRARPLRRRASRQALFQALRIAVNDELGQLDRGLPLAWELLREGGVLAGISFHSLEDRRVKRFLSERARGCICPPELPVCGCGREPEAALLARRAIVPSAGEVAHNPARGLGPAAGGAEAAHGCATRMHPVGMRPPADMFARERARTPEGSGMTPPAASAAAAAPAIHPRRRTASRGERPPTRRPRRVSGPANPAA